MIKNQFPAGPGSSPSPSITKSAKISWTGGLQKGTTSAADALAKSPTKHPTTISKK